MTEKEIIKLTDELEAHANFWMNRKDDSQGVNSAASTAISAVRQALIDALMSDNESNQPSGFSRDDLKVFAGSACIGIYDDFNASEIAREPSSVRLAWAYGQMLKSKYKATSQPSSNP